MTVPARDGCVLGTPAEPGVPDIIGLRVGALTVVRYVGRRGPKRQQYFECKCDCGGISFVRRNRLLGTWGQQGRRTCGCGRKQPRARRGVLTKTVCGGGCGKPRYVGSPEFYVAHRDGTPRPRCKDCTAKQATEWVANNQERYRTIYRRGNHKANLRLRYGLTVDEFDELWAQTDGLCAICRKPESRGRRLSLDHDHATGEVRGFLCSKCNLLLGHVSDDADRLTRAAQYLRGHRPLLVGVRFLPGFKNGVQP